MVLKRSSGIGRSVAIFYAREGADVTIVYLPAEEEYAKETQKMIEKEGRECLTLPFDLTNVKNVKRVVEKHLDKFGTLDVLVNNASRQLVCKDFAEIDLGTSTFYMY
jgi:NAD(P)-dependent dehydrogenase (short-subunit alcohol dehydrogenase family)